MMHMMMLLATLRMMYGYQLIKLFGYQMIKLITLHCGTGILLGWLSFVTWAAQVSLRNPRQHLHFPDKFFHW